MWDVEHSLAVVSLNIYKATQMITRQRLVEKTGLKLTLKQEIKSNQYQNQQEL